MARKKRHCPASPQEAPQDKPFHMPFGKLKALLGKGGQTPEMPRPVAVQEPIAPSPAQITRSNPKRLEPATSQPEPATSQPEPEQALFLTAMSDVTPLPTDRRGRVGKQPKTPPRDHRLADEMSALADLSDLVEGRGTFMIQYTDEYMEGVAPGVDRRLAQRLHQREFAIQAHLDLHGYTVDEARPAVDRFLTNAYTSGQRCVRLVHGRGRNSINNQPVLKEQVRLWLSHGRLSRLVLAFVTAPLADGGTGAVYVLLRRATHASRRK